MEKGSPLGQNAEHRRTGQEGFFRFRQVSVSVLISTAFTVIACVTVILLSIVYYNLYTNRAVLAKEESAGQFLTQTKRVVEDYLRGNRRISDALYYSSIKNTDLASDSLDEVLNIVYETNKDNVVSIALYDQDGSLVSAVPVSYRKSPEEIREQKWFTEAVQEVENLHFSMPHIQDLREERDEMYNWVISLSRAVELSRNGVPGQGVLLVDIKYASIQQMLEKVSLDTASEYIYLCDSEGNIIYHPRQEQIYAGLYEEKNTASPSDGSYSHRVGSEEYIVVTKTVSYTGWKLVSVISRDGYSLGFGRMRNLFILLISITLLSIYLINLRVSRSITSPLTRLDRSIRDIESGDLLTEIYVGGPAEVEHLGRTLQSTLERIRQLMDEVLEEQERKRRSEMDALQSQINPHFLYNTLDSVMWMIEDRQNDGAVYMIKEVAKLLRISISRGRTIITVRDEIDHARSYMNIQKIRYKNQFTCEFEVDEEIMNASTVKLILQPLLENAIYYGVQGMGDEGEILVRGTRQGDEVWLDVIDNGNGMTEEQVAGLLSDDHPRPENSSRKGNGVGLKNVDTRIKMRFGREYGITVESEIEEGTQMRIRLPYIPYEPNIEEILNDRMSPKNRKGAGTV